MNSSKRGTRGCYCSVDCWPPMSDEQKRRIATLFDADRTRERRRAERKLRRADAPAPPGLVSREFPGSPRPKGDVLQEYRSWYDVGAAKEPMWSVWYPATEDVFRWRWQFDCGCIEERLTLFDDPQSILDGSDRDPYRSRQQLPHGQYLCVGDSRAVAATTRHRFMGRVLGPAPASSRSRGTPARHPVRCVGGHAAL